MEKDNGFLQREKEVNEALEHFEVTAEEIHNGFFVMENNRNQRLQHGIESFISDFKDKGKKIKKARITIYYESDYPLIVQTITFE